MIPQVGLPWVLAAAGAALIVAGSALTVVRRWQRRSPDELERLRRLQVNHCGRITAGHVVDLIEPDASKSPARLLVYKYEVAGVTYEVAQDVSPLPAIAFAARNLVGHIASIKYNPKQPTNSIIACEEWNGFYDPVVAGAAPNPESSTPSPGSRKLKRNFER